MKRKKRRISSRILNNWYEDVLGYVEYEVIEQGAKGKYPGDDFKDVLWDLVGDRVYGDSHGSITLLRMAADDWRLLEMYQRKAIAKADKNDDLTDIILHMAFLFLYDEGMAHWRSF